MRRKNLDGPIFIGGEGRSGTTLLALMLNSHPDIACGLELHFRDPVNLGTEIIDAIPLYETYGEAPLKGLPEAQRRSVNFIRRCMRLGVSPSELVTLIETEQEKSGDELTAFEARCELVDKVGQLLKDKEGARIWGIKIMRDIRIADKYAEHWPRAIFIHLVRDGRDVAASQLRDHSGWGYRNIDAAAESWRAVIKKAEEHAQNLTVINVRYEDLVLESKKTLMTLLAQLGVDWDSAVIEHCSKRHPLLARPSNHPSHDAVSRPINTQAVRRYIDELSKEEIACFQDKAGRELERYGYQLL